ncbi:MAG: hypothetical protein H7831_15540 [Magnetococcus sp. WYHC-3]
MGKGNPNPKPNNILQDKAKRSPGRPKGVTNKIPTEAKDHIIRVFELLQKNPKSSLRGRAEDDPSWFYDSIWKLIVPKQISADVNHDISGNLMELAVQVAQELRLNGDSTDK